MKGHSGGIRKELIFGFVGIMLLCAAVTHVGIFLFSRSSFDTLVHKSDVEMARSIAASLAPYYGAHGSWAGVEAEIGKLGATFLKQNLSMEERNGEIHRGDGDFRGRDEGLPLVIADGEGLEVYPGHIGEESPFGRGEKGPERYKTSLGVEVAWNGKAVGYVFFKSMLKSAYNPHEKAFLSSLGASIGVSVLFGVVLAVTLGAFFAARFVRPIIELDAAVQKVANRESGVRARRVRRDEIGHLADNFNVMAARIESTELARKNLLADIAHELRTPVSIIQANLEMIIDGVYAADSEKLKSLYEETRILTDLIGNLREISDLESGTVPLNPQPVRVQPLLADTCEKYRPLFDERRVKIAFRELQDETLSVSSDEDRLRQVVRNVLVNALKYAPEGSVVSIACEPVQRGAIPFLEIRIADEGPGVPEGDLEKIFERFYRVDASRNRDSGGRGLGLAICRQFVEASGGMIFARNRPPHGLEVCMDLPACGKENSKREKR